MLKFTSHSRRVWRIAQKYGWMPGARYTNLRDVRECQQLGFLDIDWENYDYRRHLSAAKQHKPLVTVAQDIRESSMLQQTLDQADELFEHATHVVIVPKAPELASCFHESIPERFLLGYSVPTCYGSTSLPLTCFGRRPVHLLGGRPDIQRRLAISLNVVSLDCNRFTLDAAFGDYFDGDAFRPHPIGGYERCIDDSLCNITALWVGYRYTAEPSQSSAEAELDS